jgi:hypothetical protein
MTNQGVGWTVNCNLAKADVRLNGEKPMQKRPQIRTPMLRLLACVVVMAVVVTYPHDAAGENWAHA